MPGIRAYRWGKPAWKGGIGLGLLSALVAPVPLEAQDPPSDLGAFVSVGAGFGSHFTPHASLSVVHPTGDYLVRVASGYGADLGEGTIWGGIRELTELSLLYGRRKAWSHGWIRGALGVGYVEGPQSAPVAPGEEPRTRGAGLAAQLGIAWTLLPTFGVGLTGVGNLNEVRSVGAVTLALHVGRLR